MQNLEWRRKNRINSIHEEKDCEVMTKYYPFKAIGWDKLGQPRTHQSNVQLRNVLDYLNACVVITV